MLERGIKGIGNFLHEKNVRHDRFHGMSTLMHDILQAKQHRLEGGDNMGIYVKTLKNGEKGEIPLNRETINVWELQLLHTLYEMDSPSALLQGMRGLYYFIRDIQKMDRLADAKLKYGNDDDTKFWSELENTEQVGKP